MTKQVLQRIKLSTRILYILTNNRFYMGCIGEFSTKNISGLGNKLSKAKLSQSDIKTIYKAIRSM